MDPEQAVAQMDTSGRFWASEERNSGHTDRDRRNILNAAVHCSHGLDPDCYCARNFSTNKSDPLTEQEAKVGAASFARSEMEKFNEQDHVKYSLLSKIIKCKADKRNHYINQYETKYGPLLTKDILDIDESISHLKIPEAGTTQIRFDFLLSF